MAPCRNDFLHHSLRQWVPISRLLKLFLSLSRVLWRGWETLSMIASSFASILSSVTSSRVTSLEPTTDSAFLVSSFSLFAFLCLDAHNPEHHSEEDRAHNNRLIKHLEHQVVDIEGPEPPQEVKLAQTLKPAWLSVTRRDQSTTKVSRSYPNRLKKSCCVDSVLSHSAVYK